MTAQVLAPCQPWCNEADLMPPCSDDYDVPRFEEAAMAASGILWRLSGRQYPGVCTATVRPCAKPRMMGNSGEWPAGLSFHTSGWPGWAMTPPSGWFVGWGSCDCNRAEQCGCGSLSQIELPGPIDSIGTVKVDGVTLTANTDYRVDDNRWLVRLNGSWPCCQRQNLPSTEKGTFEVTYDYGLAPPPEGVIAAAELTCELLHAMLPDLAGKDCKLPRKVVSVVKQGVSLAIVDISQFLQNGGTGLYWCDLFIGAHNPHGVQEPAAVYSPDLRRAPRRVGT